MKVVGFNAVFNCNMDPRETDSERKLWFQQEDEPTAHGFNKKTIGVNKKNDQRAMECREDLLDSNRKQQNGRGHMFKSIEQTAFKGCSSTQRPATLAKDIQ
jgi:hypothetical protein